MANGKRSVRLVHVDESAPTRQPINWKAVGALLAVAMALLGGYARFIALEEGQESTNRAIEKLEHRIDRIAEKLGAY
jgi:hypothetical protein